jgi:hypothetical protein
LLPHQRCFGRTVCGRKADASPDSTWGTSRKQKRGLARPVVLRGDRSGPTCSPVPRSWPWPGRSPPVPRVRPDRSCRSLTRYPARRPVAR